ncbi:MAG: hypothetical protein CL916_09760 [Deltaproteobacteria bacterium]|nr:hypothetical protein [Deltaproteobacteria bacterium]
MMIHAYVLFLLQANANPTADCKGTLIVTIDNNGSDKMSAIEGQFQLLMSDDGTANMSTSAPKMPTLK